MKLFIQQETIPLKIDADGVVRIGESRVTLDTVLYAFNDGAAVEEIVEMYPVLRLADVYSVIGYYLHHRSELDSYLKARESFAGKIRRENERRFPSHGLRERLLARRK